jgi:hypothetical protein
VESSEGYELEFVPHGAQLALEDLDRRIVEFLFPVEGGRAIICEQLAGMLLVYGLRKYTRIAKIRVRRFPPQQIGNIRVGEAACYAMVKSRVSGGRSLPACDRLLQ